MVQTPALALGQPKQGTGRAMEDGEVSTANPCRQLRAGKAAWPPTPPTLTSHLHLANLPLQLNALRLQLLLPLQGCVASWGRSG